MSNVLFLFFRRGTEKADDQKAGSITRASQDPYTFGPAKSDPVTQVMDTLNKALERGAVLRKDGAFTSFANVARRTAFIIADLTPSLVNVVRRHDFRNDFDPSVFVRYRDNEGVFIQTFGYNTLITHAKKRNQAFFSVLMGE